MAKLGNCQPANKRPKNNLGRSVMTQKVNRRKKVNRATLNILCVRQRQTRRWLERGWDVAGTWLGRGWDAVFTMKKMVFEEKLDGDGSACTQLNSPSLLAHFGG